MSYTAIIAAHYLVIFPLLVIYYYRILYYIKKLKRVNGKLVVCVKHNGQESSQLAKFLVILSPSLPCAFHISTDNKQL